MSATSPIIHPTAVVDPSAELGPGVTVGPYAIVEGAVMIGEGCSIGPHAIIGCYTRMGARNVIHGHAAVGVEPQDLSFKGEPTWLVMGDENRVREFATLNRGTLKGDGSTKIGNRNLFMSCSHVAHDCTIGDGVILANNVLLAGHVVVHDRAILNGAAGVQQFATIGRCSYVGGLTRIVHDVPPFMVVEGHPSKVRKVNTVGLQRNGFGAAAIESLRLAHRKLFRSLRPKSEVIDEIQSHAEVTPEVHELCEFLRRMERGRNGRSLES